MSRFIVFASGGPSRVSRIAVELLWEGLFSVSELADAVKLRVGAVRVTATYLINNGFEEGSNLVLASNSSQMWVYYLMTEWIWSYQTLNPALMK